MISLRGSGCRRDGRETVVFEGIHYHSRKRRSFFSFSGIDLMGGISFLALRFAPCAVSGCRRFVNFDGQTLTSSPDLFGSQVEM